MNRVTTTNLHITILESTKTGTGIDVVGNIRHALHTTSQDDILLAKHNRLGSQHNGLHTRGADLVDSGGDGALGQAGSKRNLASGSLTHVGGDDVTEINLLNLLRLDTCANL
jgi:hypothetical protein